MGEGSKFPPYAPRVGFAASVHARRGAMEQRRRMLHDADQQEQLGRRAILAAARNRRFAVAVTALAAVAALVLLYLSWSLDDLSEHGYLLASWALLGGTMALGVLYIGAGSIKRAARRREAGERLLKRATRQRERAGGKP